VPDAAESLPPDPPSASRGGSPAARLRRIHREDALEQVELATLAQAYREGHPVYLGRGEFWRWEQDGIPRWLVPRFEDLGFLP
jgi:hypothetical protein